MAEHKKDAIILKEILRNLITVIILICVITAVVTCFVYYEKIDIKTVRYIIPVSVIVSCWTASAIEKRTDPKNYKTNCMISGVIAAITIMLLSATQKGSGEQLQNMIINAAGALIGENIPSVIKSKSKTRKKKKR